jgi:hypothetical protein
MRRGVGHEQEGDVVKVSTNDLLLKGHKPHGTGWWMRPNWRAIVREQDALREVSEQIEAAQKEEKAGD